jgi:hypothetical protein
MGDSAFRGEDFTERKVVTLSPVVKGLAGRNAREQQHVMQHNMHPPVLLYRGCVLRASADAFASLVTSQR